MENETAMRTELNRLATGSGSGNSIGVNGGFLSTLFFIFLVLKLTNVINWSWWWVTAPLWAIPAIVVGIVGIVLGIAGIVLVIGLLAGMVTGIYHMVKRMFGMLNRGDDQDL